MHTDAEVTAAEQFSGTVSGKAIVSVHPRGSRLTVPCLMTLMLLAGISGVVILSLLANRTHWRTVLGKGKSGSLVFAVDYPNNWKRTEAVNNTNLPAAMRPLAFELKRQPTTGFLAWWTRVVLHQDNSAAAETQISVAEFSAYVGSSSVVTAGRNTILSTQGTAMLDSIEKDYKTTTKSLPGCSITMQRTQHPLGPALHMTYTLYMSQMPGSGNTKVAGKPVGEVWYIVPQKAPANSPFYLMVACSSSATEARSLKPLYDEVIQRVHLVKKP